MASLISAVSWIPRGAAAAHPTKYTVDEAELARVGQLAQLKLEDAQMELELARAAQGGDGMSEDDRVEDEDEDDGWEE